MGSNDFQNFLNGRNCLKIICGAGNSDLREITNLCALYAKAGCRFFDVNASVEAVKAAKQGIKSAGAEKDCFICVSVGTKDDPHFIKCSIDSSVCIGCGACEKACPQTAIKNTNGIYSVIEEKCIGCGKCTNVCQQNAIRTHRLNYNLAKTLTELIQEGIDCLEYHIITDDEENIMSGWVVITKLYKGPISVCSDRSKFGNEKVIRCLKKMKETCENLFIVQADGAPMSGGENDYRTTLQAAAMADITEKAGITPYIFVSGGTNSKTKELLDLCNIDITGISIGSYARKIVKKYIVDENLLTDKLLFEEGVEVAKTVV